MDLPVTAFMSCTKMVANWMRRLSTAGGSGGGSERNVETVAAGMCSLAFSCILCSCRTSVMHFVLNGGLASLAGMFKMRGATALMTRYMICATELISLTAGPIGCEALLGLLHPGERSLEKPEADILHVPGIVSAKITKDSQLSPHRTASPPPSLPPGMISPHKKAAEEDIYIDKRKPTKEEKMDEIERSSSKNEKEYEDLEDSGRRRSSGKKKDKKKRRSKHRSYRDRSSEHRESRRSREEKEGKRHRSHRHSSAERSKKSSRTKDKVLNNGRNSRSKEPRRHPTSPLQRVSEKRIELSGPSVKRQKCDHSSEEHLTCIDLTKEGRHVLSSVPMYDLLFDILLQPRPQGIIQSVRR